MPTLVKPEVFLFGFTEAYEPGIKAYLQKTKQTDFWQQWEEARAVGISSGEALCSLYAKLCYKSLVLGKNNNVKKIRDIGGNLKGCFDTGHGSVFEHCQINYLVTDCSRVYTHEQVRHRVGFSYSQTSGRYCRLDQIDLVWDPILDPVKDLFLDHLTRTEAVVYLAECRLGLRKPNGDFPDAPAEACLSQDDLSSMARPEVQWEPDDSYDFERRKKITSAIRRIAPNGQSNEIGISVNIRALRHVVQLRTSRHSEREIRDIYSQIYFITKAKFPTLFYRAREKFYDELPEIYGMKTQPYELDANDPKALELFSTADLQKELSSRA